MDAIHISLLGILVAILGAGGGIWVWGRDKVKVSDCTKEHSGVAKQLDAIDKKIDKGFTDITVEISGFRSSVKDDFDKVQGRITSLQDRVAHVEGKVNGKV